MKKYILLSIFSVLLFTSFMLTSCNNDPAIIEEEKPPGSYVSDPISLTGGSAVYVYATSDTVANITESTLSLRSEITELDVSTSIIEHGHIWSSTVKNPQVFIEGSFSKLGGINSAGIFETYIENWYSNTTYYYRSYIKLRGDLILYYPQVSEYTTGSVGAKYIDILTPNYTYSSATGRMLDISWNTNISDNVKVDLLKDKVFVQTLTEGVNVQEPFYWIIPENLDEGSDYQVKVTDISNSEISNTSDNFTVVDNQIKILTPTSDDIWSVGGTYEITWEDDLDDQLQIELYKGLALQQTLAGNTDSDGTFSWQVENIEEDGQDYRIKLINVNDTNMYVFSNDFEIRELQNYAIEILHPTDTSSWTKGTEYNIVWTDNIVDDVKIELFKGTTSIETIVSATPSSGLYTWTVPMNMQIGADFTIKITDSTDEGISATSLIFLIEDSSEDAILTDYDGNEYKTVKIGYQTWMAENLRAEHFADGTAVMNGTNFDFIDATDIRKMFFYYDDITTNLALHGLLYSWSAVVGDEVQGNEIQGICPTGWHMPSSTEWETLSNYLGGNDVSGTKLKESGSENWILSNSEGTNISHFTGLPSGNRNQNGTFSGNLESIGYFWSATESVDNTVWVRSLRYNAKTFYKSASEKTKAYSIRCIMNQN